MAISLLQDAQTRSLAAALAGMKRDDIDRSISLSPPMSANTSVSGPNALYPGLQQATANSAFGMLSPSQLLEVNRHAAAAFMTLPMSALATTLFPHHHATLFNSWASTMAHQQHQQQHQHQPSTTLPAQTTHLHSPPASPISPKAITPMAGVKHALSSPTTVNTPASSNAQSGGEGPLKKSRKIAVKKEFQSPSSNGSELPISIMDMYTTPGGPISPPSSGSSPSGSTHEAPIMPNTAQNANGKDPARDKSFTCKICSRSFGYKHVLQNHERTHTGEKPFECPECHKRFTRDHHLKTHMRLHTGEKPYHCSHCDRQFVQVANLRRHLRVHTGERPYTCEICEGKFSDSNQLKSHMLVHNGEKPFECERCHMKFRRRHHLMNHKCGVQSPPTPALSPVMSADFASEQSHAVGKYSSSFGCEEPLELGKPTAMSQIIIDNLTGDVEHDAPLDLSEDGASSVDGNVSLGSSRSRKANDIRRVFRLPPPQILHVPTDLPEQTEPEDLSMHSPRGEQLTPESLHMLHAAEHTDDDDDIDLNDLDDAASMFMRQQQEMAAAALKHGMHMI